MMNRLLLHPADRPLLSLGIRAGGGPFAVLVNDVPVLYERDAGALDVTLPINEWVFRGMNEIRLESRPHGDDGTGPEVTLTYRRASQSLQQTVVLTALAHRGPPGPEYVSAATSGEEDAAFARSVTRPGQPVDFVCEHHLTGRRADGTLVTVATFDLPAAWPVCPWLEADVLTGKTRPLLPVTQSARNFWHAVQRKHAAAWREILAVRMRGLQAGYSLDEAEAEEALLFPKLVRSAGWRVVPLEETNLALEYAGRGRLARLMDRESQESPLRLVSEASETEAVVEIWWARLRQRWVVMA